MRLYFLAIFFISSISISFSQETIGFKKGTEAAVVPIITFEEGLQHLGDVKSGESRDLVYEFTNTGTDFLEIELVTACQCTSIVWPHKPIAPGEKSKITVTYNSTDQKLGYFKKALDIIANTDPIVVEAFFTVNVVE